LPYKYRIQTETYTVYPLQIKENILVANIWARLVASFSDSLSAEGTRKSAYAHTLHLRRTTAKTETIRFSALLILLQFLVSVALHALSCFSTSVSLFKLIHNWTVFYNVSPIPKLNQLFFLIRNSPPPKNFELSYKFCQQRDRQTTSSECLTRYQQ